MSETRETTSADEYQAIPRSGEGIASGRAEETSFLTKTWSFFDLFGKKWRSEPLLSKKDVQFRPAGGESGRLSRQMPGLEPTA